METIRRQQIEAGTGTRRRVVHGLAVLLLALTGRVAGGEELTFITIDPDPETDAADKLLASRLHQHLERELNPKPYGYEETIRILTEWRSRKPGSQFVARLTPYVYIAAEMLGADMEILGTYRSRATEKTTYHSYFVVHRDRFPGKEDGEVELGDLLAFLRESERPRFIYHDRFSTSSYFLPSLFFRANRVFNTEHRHDRLTAIRSDGLEKDQIGSTELVERVARGEADFAAVWDGTKSKFDAGGKHHELGRRVIFIQLPTPLPNDLLVCSAGLEETAKANIRRALAGEPEGSGLRIGRGDFSSWVDIERADEARDALGELRWLAREAPAPVTVRIEAAKSDPASEWHLEAARQAVRLSGTEFVLHDPGFHRRVDFVWRLRRIREGYLELESEISDVGLSQSLRIGFPPGDQDELAARINRSIHTRLHRVRYLWPYEKDNPLVIRDLLFSLPAESAVKIQRIRWQDPQRNYYAPLGTYDVKIASSDKYKFTIRCDDVSQLSRDPESTFDPMSNVAHRVILIRPDEPHGMFNVFKGALYGLVAVAVLGSVLTRKRQEA